jgi:hypothetical protein
MATRPRQDELARFAAIRGLQRERALAALADANRAVFELTGQRSAAADRLDRAQRDWEALQSRPILDLTFSRLGARTLLSCAAGLDEREALLERGRKAAADQSEVLTHSVAAADLAERLARRAARGGRRQRDEAALAAAEDRFAAKERS